MVDDQYKIGEDGVTFRGDTFSQYWTDYQFR